MINIAIVGFGGMGEYHSNLIKNNPNYTITGVYDICEKRIEIAQNLKFKTYETYDQLLKDNSVDVVLVVTPNDSHKELSIKALKANKNVICEKPVTITVDEFKEILKVSKEVNKSFVIHQNRRWDEDYLIIQEIINKNIIGDVFHIESRVLGSAGIPGDWRKIKNNGGGMLYDWGIHLFDQILQLENKEIKSIFYKPSYILGEEVDDGFISYFTFKDGTTSIIEVQTTNAINLPRWYIKGTKGTAIINDWSNKGKIIVTKDKFKKNTSKPIKAGAGFTKTMAPLSDSKLEEIELPKPIFYEKDFYTHYFETYENNNFKVKNEEVMKVMEIIEKLSNKEESTLLKY